MTATPDVFLSYNREDSGRARHFAEAFAEAGFEVWWDVTLRSGEAYDEVTEAALRGAKAVVVLWSPRSVVSRWVRAEATIADRCKTLVPAMIEPCERPIMFELTQTADLSHWTGDAGDKAWLAFLGDVRRFVGRDASAPNAPATPTSAKIIGPNRRSLIMAGSGAALALAVGGFAAWKTGLFEAEGLASSVAVLPFKNLGGDPEQNYFVDGLTEEIRSSLSREPLLQVAASTSSSLFRNQEKSLPEVAKALGVEYVLDGSVRWESDTVRIAVQLIDGKTGFGTWSRAFDRPFEEVLELQSELARAVTDVLTAQASGIGVEKAGSDLKRSGGTVSPAAFDAFLRGSAHFAKRSGKSDFEQALAEADRAIALDPRYAAALTLRALSLFNLKYSARDPLESQRFAELALHSAKQAIDLAPEFPSAHSIMAVMLRANLKFRESRPYDERCYELGQGSAGLLVNFALNSSASGRFRPAFHAINRAVLLDPLNANVWMALSYVQFWAKQYVQSIQSARKAFEIDPDYGGGAKSEIEATRHFHMKRYKEVISLLPKFSDLELRKFLTVLINIRTKNEYVSAHSYLSELEAAGDGSLYARAEILAQMGETAKAITALETAYRLKDGRLGDLAVEPLLDPLRKEPKFKALLDLVGVAA